MAYTIRHFQSLEVGEVILQGRISPVDVDEALMRQFVVDASEGALDLCEFIVTFAGSKPSTDTKIKWHREREEWFREPSGDNA